MEPIYEQLKKTSDKNGEVEFQATIPAATLERFETHALAHAAQDLELPGFRKGKVPERIAREHIDSMALIEAAANDALEDAVRQIMKNEELSIVGSPRITITKIAPKNPLEFKVRFARYPSVTLPDYKKIGTAIAARKDPEPEVTDADIEEATTRILAMLSRQDPSIDTKETKPELTDELAARLGPFKNVDEFKAKLRENLKEDKTVQQKEARREEMMRTVVEKSGVKIPDLLIDEEWHAFEERRNAQLEEAKIPLDDYLKQTKKTEKDLEKEERALITERIKTSVVFRAIQKEENIQPTEREIQTNIAHLKLRYKDRSEYWLRETAEALLIQEKIFAILGMPMGEVESS